MPDTKRATYGKTALIDDVTAQTTGMTRRQVEQVINACMDTIARKVATGQNVTLTGFGTWRRSQRAARTGVNIRTREKIQIPAQNAVVFSAGSEFKAAVQGRRGSYAQERAKAGLGKARQVGGR